MSITQLIINPYGDIQGSDVILQKALIGLNTNKRLMVQFKNIY